MPAAAPAKSGKSASSSSSSSKSKSTTASSSSKTTGKESGFGKAVKELRDKRAAYTQPVVDTPVAVVGGGETKGLDEKDTIEVVPQGSSVEITVGGKTVALDREGVFSLQNQLNQIAIGL